MKLLTFINQNKTTILSLAVVALLILLFVNPCNKDSEEIARLKSENKTLQDEKKKTEQDIAFQRRRYTADSTDARGREELAHQEKQEADSKVKQQQRTIDRLADIVRANRVEFDYPENLDTVKFNSYVVVSRSYKNACDSLPNEIDKLNTSLAEKDSAINEWSGILAYEIQLRDSALEAEQKHSAKLDDLYNRQNKIVEAALRAAKPRGRLLGGVGLIGNETNPLSGTKINLAYQSKGGKQYTVGGILFKGGVYYEAGVMITLIK